MFDKLNDLTAAELADLKARARKETRLCLWCDKQHTMRVGQHFCSARCRANYANAAARLAYEKMVQEKQAWLIERDALIREVAELRKQLES